MNIPQELKYTKDHEWIKVDGNEVLIGITDFAQQELGDIVYVEIETEGEELSKGDVFGTVEAVKTVSDLFMPVNGKLIEVNANLESEPETVNTDPYEKGWMIKVEIKDGSALDDVLSADDYLNLISG
ncbi:MAG: glycine cleavage system protein GcvH [Cyclobacteriaceae bacterium]|nr:glycine cleavage system protein GcvH [Cyclobacteriaceae bacterium]MCK5280685.1 glycine cleavage system protein GcvH [Cyclobacteriaceae bacterium]MCK5468581.1 glycine cleavage system protein GcvH [Cyclobacteriaceae bacterium]